jgi:hypothetical protein
MVKKTQYKGHRTILLLSVILFIGVFFTNFISATITTDGIKTYMDISGTNYTILRFNSNGYFNATNELNISVLIVAGGGGGGGSGGGDWGIGGGGGAGQIIYYNEYSTNGNKIISVGNGGGIASNGFNSSFGNLISMGGGAGGIGLGGYGSNGGSGGGGSWYNGVHGNGIYGYNGGNGGGSSNDWGSGGGGGAGGVGGNGNSSYGGGTGGIGAFYNIYNGTSLCYAGGGGGTWGGAGGKNYGHSSCGGGVGGNGDGYDGINALSNSGGGGGAGGYGSGGGGLGGSGIVILRYLTPSSCTENLVNTSWIYENISCMVNDSLIQSGYLIQYDANVCNITENQTFYEYINFDCNYCSFYPVNTTIQDWVDTTSCVNDTKTQSSEILTYDFNYDTCYSLTGLESDYFENITYDLNRDISCVGSNVGLFAVNLESKTTILIFAFIFIFVIILGYLRHWLFVGGLLVVLGFILIFNGFNIIISFIIIASGVIAFFLK